jgi:hypothetical protein
VGECSREESASLCVSRSRCLYDGVVVGIRGIEPCLKTSVQSHGMR